ncbi:hypothetical protein EYF80_054882 [Liparis tanakae]
MCSA